MTVGYRCCANCWRDGLRPNEPCRHIQELIDEAKGDSLAAQSSADLAALAEGMGLAMMPVKPTFDMIDDACYCAETDLDPFPDTWAAQQAHAFMKAAYDAMLAAGRIKTGLGAAEGDGT